MNLLVPRRVLLPGLFVYALIVLLPCCYMLARGIFGPWRRIWLTTRQWLLVGNTIGLAVLAASAAVIAGTILAFLIARTDVNGRMAIFFAAISQLFLPPHLLVIAVQYLGGGRLGGLMTAAAVLATSYYPLAFLLVLAGLRSIDSGQEEAALLVQTPGAVLRRLSTPLVYPHIFASWLVIALLSLTDYGVPDLLQLNTYPVEIFAQFSAFYDHAAAAALSAPLVVLGMAMVFLIQALLADRSFVPGKNARRTVGALVGLGHWKWTVSTGVVLLTAAPLAFSVLSFVVHVVTSSRTVTYMLTSAPIISSIAVAAIAATCTVFLAVPVAYAAERLRPAAAKALQFAVLIPLAVPATVVGIGLIGVWNRNVGVPFYGTWAMPIVASVVRFSPFAIMILYTSLKQLPVEQEQAALLASSSWVRRIARIVSPQCRNGIVIAWTLSFILSFGELGASLLIMPPGAETLTVRLFNLLHYGAHDMVSCLALVIVAVGMAGCGVILRVTRIAERSQA